MRVEFSVGVVVDAEADDEEVEIVYDTAEDTPLALDLSLKDIPTGTFTGTMTGDAAVSGDVEADATFDLTLTGELEEDPDNAGEVIRKAGTLHIVGTVSAAGDSFEVDVTR